jgi:hypothetical protein
MSKLMSEKKTVEVVIIKKRLLYLIVITLVTAMISPFGTVVYVNYVDRKNRQDWCDLVTTFNKAYENNPPDNETAKRVAELMERRRESLGCK